MRKKPHSQRVKEGIRKAKGIAANIVQIEKYRCSHPKAQSGDNYCTLCGKQLKDFRYKKCIACGAWICEEEWASMTFINKKRKEHKANV